MDGRETWKDSDFWQNVGNFEGIKLDAKIYTHFEFPFYTALLGLVNTMIPNELGHLKTHRRDNRTHTNNYSWKSPFDRIKTRQK